MPENPGFVVSASSTVVSPAELLNGFINTYADKAIVPAGSVVGGADDNEQQAGVISIMDAGNTKQEMYAPLLWKRCQLRCLAPSLMEADRIGNYAFQLLNDQKWLELEDHRGAKWFVHLISCTTGPSHHLDSKETFESLFYANITVGSEPIFQPSPDE